LAKKDKIDTYSKYKDMQIEVPENIANIEGLGEREYIFANFLYQLREYYGKGYFYEFDNYDVKDILNIEHKLANKSHSFQAKFKNLIAFHKAESITLVKPEFSYNTVLLEIHGEYEQDLYEYLLIKIKENTDGVTNT